MTLLAFLIGILTVIVLEVLALGWWVMTWGRKP